MPLVEEDRPTIYDEVLEEGEFLALAFARNVSRTEVAQGVTRLMDFDIAFFEVTGHEHLQYRPLDVYDSSGTARGPISASSGLDFGRLYDSNGDDVARVETDENPWQLSHFSLSVLEDDIRVYPRIPETEPKPGWSWAVGDEPDPTSGDNFGYVPGNAMKWESPPAELQTVGFESGDRSTIQYGFYNENPNLQVDPTLNVLGRTYRTAPVVNPDRQLEILRMAMNPGENPGFNVITYSRVTEPVTVNLPTDWTTVGNVQTFNSSELREMIP